MTAVSRSAVSSAVAAVERSTFVGGGAASPSYAGRSHPPPSTLAQMIAALRLPAHANVLLVGAGSGYAAAVLSKLAKHVYALERVESLASAARARLTSSGVSNVTLRCGDGHAGWPTHAPYDGILVLAALSGAPSALLEQLLPDSSLVMPTGPRRSEQPLVRLIRQSSGPPTREELGVVSFTESLGDTLGALGIADRAIIARAEALARESGRPLADELRQLVHVDDADLLRALATSRGMKFGTASELAAQVDPKLFERVPRAFCDHHRLLPISRAGDVIRVVGTGPDAPFSDIGLVFPGSPIEPWLVTATDFKRLWSMLELRLAGEEFEASASADAESGEGKDLLSSSERKLDARAVTLFDSLLLDAVGERASDIHLERYGDRPRVRIRVDGDLRDLPQYQLKPLELVGVVNVIKIRAQLDISERRLPQSGRSRMRVGDNAFDLRVQTQPSLHGEHVIIRLLPQEQRLLTIEGLGFPAPVAARYRRLLDNPSGLVLVVGPTGSGKSTTLYAALQVLARDPTRKVITIEDPIEYALDGVQQSQVKPEIGFAFADAMRAFVRQDPDVILVGEIRDGETALEALRASQTGHLVLSTLHCNDATDAVQRLFDLGMHPNSIASELLTVISQRLAKRICDGCRAPAEPEPALFAEVFPTGAPEGFRCFAGAGCARCGGHGTRGRIAVIELMAATPKVRNAISRHVPVDDMRRLALEGGLVTARQSALEHVTSGAIPFSELPHLLPGERMAGEPD